MLVTMLGSSGGTPGSGVLLASFFWGKEGCKGFLARNSLISSYYLPEREPKAGMGRTQVSQ